MADESTIVCPGDFGPFHLEKELGHGGMGGVYLGKDKMLDRPCAIKVMLASLGNDPEFVEKFKKEAQAAAKLQHPNIAQIYRFDIFEGRPYIAMELCSGGSLDGEMEKTPGRLDVVHVMRVGEQLASALSIAAEAGLVHGDVKPENVLYDTDGNAKLVDFGLAAMQADSNEIWGTPYYISPEKCLKKKLDFRADIYSLGGTLYHALTGVPPFDGEDAVAVVKARFQGPPKKPSELRPDIPPEVDEIIMRMLEVEPNRRHPTYKSLLGDFKRYLSKFPQTTGAKPGGKKLTIKGRKPKITSPVAATQAVPTQAGMAQPPGAILPGRFGMDPALEAAEEEEGMGVGKMIGIAAGGVALAIAGLVGGLLWYQHSAAVAKEESALSDTRDVLLVARKSALENIRVAKEYNEKIKACADAAQSACEKMNADLLTVLTKEMREAFGDSLVPDANESQHIIEAVAFTNKLAEAKSPPKAVEAPAPAPAPDAAATNAPPATAEGEKNKAADGAAVAAENAAPATEEAEEGASADSEEAGEGAEAEDEAAQPAVAMPQSVKDLLALWDDAYLCRAAAIRTAAQLDGAIADAEKLIEAAQAEEGAAGALPADARNDITARYEAAAQLYGKAGKLVKEVYDVARSAKINETAQAKSKAIPDRIKTRLAAVRKEIDREQRRIEKEQKAKAEAEEKERSAQEKAEKHRELAEAEIQKAKTAFEDLVGGRLRFLSWEPAIKQLQAARGTFDTREGTDEIDFQIWKVTIMQDFHKHLVKFAKGLEFNNKARTMIVDSNDKQFTIQNRVYDTKTGKYNPDGKLYQVDWTKLYKASDEAYKGVRMDWLFGKMISILVVKGRESERSDLRSELANTKRWADRQLGAALTLITLCGENESAVDLAKNLVKPVVKKFDTYEAKAKRLFPDMDFAEDAGEE